MVEIPKTGTSINHQEQLEADRTTDPLTSRMLEDQTTCKPGTPTVDGSSSSDLRVNTSSISRTRKHSMYLEVETLKDKMLLFGRSTTASTKDGLLFTKMTGRLPKHQVWATMASRLMSHSTLYQECQ
jgi:hypothetical protein